MPRDRLKNLTKRVECRPVLWSRMWKARDLDGISFIRGENLDETVDLFFDEKKKKGNNGNRDLHRIIDGKSTRLFILFFRNFIHFPILFLFFFLHLKIFHFSNFKYKNNFFFSKNTLVYHYTNFKSNYIVKNYILIIFTQNSNIFLANNSLKFYNDICLIRWSNLSFLNFNLIQSR